MIRLAIIHAQAIYCQSLAKYLDTNRKIEVVASVNHLRQLLADQQDQVLDVVLWHIPSHHALPPGLRILKERYPTVKIVALTEGENNLYSGLLLNLGADLAISANASPPELFKTILQAHNQYVPPPSSNHVQDPAPMPLTAPQKLLSKREQQILQLICEGYTDPQIAKQLGLSKRTVDGHRQRLRKKLMAPNTALLVRRAIERALIPVTNPSNLKL